MLPWKFRKRHILPVNQDLLSVYFSLAKFQLVSFNLSIAMICQMTYTQKLPKLCSATLTKMILVGNQSEQSKQYGVERQIFVASITATEIGACIWCNVTPCDHFNQSLLSRGLTA